MHDKGNTVILEVNNISGGKEGARYPQIIEMVMPKRNYIVHVDSYYTVDENGSTGFHRLQLSGRIYGDSPFGPEPIDVHDTMRYPWEGGEVGFGDFKLEIPKLEVPPELTKLKRMFSLFRDKRR